MEQTLPDEMDGKKKKAAGFTAGGDFFAIRYLANPSASMTWIRFKGCLLSPRLCVRAPPGDYAAYRSHFFHLSKPGVSGTAVGGPPSPR